MCIVHVSLLSIIFRYLQKGDIYMCLLSDAMSENALSRIYVSLCDGDKILNVARPI